MVRKVEIALFDDFTGEPAHRTVAIGFNESWFELDLTDANADQVIETLVRWSAAGRKRTEAATRAEAGAGAGLVKRTRAERDRATAIRAWAQSEGMDVSPRGRIAKNVIHAYDTRTTHRGRRPRSPQ